MVWWELSPRNRHPVVNFRVLKNGELAASIFLFVALGFGLYGGVFIFPLFTQSHPPLHAHRDRPGAAAGRPRDRGHRAHLRAPAQRARPLVDPRILIAIGVAIFVCAMWDLGHLTDGRRRARRAHRAHHPRRRARLPVHADQQRRLRAASSPARRSRRPGSSTSPASSAASFGIAILATYLTVHTQIHRVDLIAQRLSGPAAGGGASAGVHRQPGRARVRPRRRPPRRARAARPAGDAAGRDAELQRRLDAAAHRASSWSRRPSCCCGKSRGRARRAGRRALSETPPRRARRPNVSAGSAALPPRRSTGSRSSWPIRAARSGATGTPAPGRFPRASWTRARSCSTAARREFEEETGIHPREPFLPLGSVRQKAGKVVHAWAWEGDAEPSRGRSATARASSGRRARDAGSRTPRWTGAHGSIRPRLESRINPAQAELIDRLEQRL